MNLQSFDLGEIIKNHVYVREIYSTNLKDQCLFSTESFLKRIGRLYDYLGIHWRNLWEFDIRVKLPNNPNPSLRDYWNETIIKRLDQRASITITDRFSRYYYKEVIFASSAWMGEFDSFPGDEIIISPLPCTQLSLRHEQVHTILTY